jgi:MEMO1 family protein
MKGTSDIRPSPIAGKWYPADPEQLAASVDQYINTSGQPPLSGELVALMVPHAGHRYSGPVAGYAFALLRTLLPEALPELVAVISPMHYPSRYAFLTSAHGAYVTPLGTVPVDEAALGAVEETLQNELGFGLAAVKRDQEHSLEIELPFLQRALPDGFSLLPVMVHAAQAADVRALGSALYRALAGKRALLVASTDLSHFYPQELAKSLDAEVLRRVAALDPQAVLDVESQGKGFACGRAALAAVLWAARDLGGNHVEILCHATSGDVTGEFNQVVGYAAAAVTRLSLEE